MGLMSKTMQKRTLGYLGKYWWLPWMARSLQLGKVVCWPFTLMLMLPDFSFTALLTHIPVQRNEHSHFNQLIFQKQVPCPFYPQTIALIGKMFSPDNHTENKNTPPWSRDSEESWKKEADRSEGRLKPHSPQYPKVMLQRCGRRVKRTSWIDCANAHDQKDPR